MKENFQNIINSSQQTLVDFYADWCGPCKSQTPILKELAATIKGKARIIKINVDNNQALAAKFQVRGVPTLILFKNGQVVWRQSGVATKQQLSDLINQNL
ncbi:thioredoxin [Labilibaculum antarcticum]|uniref:Thioredoxin n=1 Tax=Labilibaculum antarcticum TaxID=1717717 RepID=A0A1Y1CH32_9BACT|nr:thioredoxin [Labilibaculum antarcticum]BAX79332.1 thioredoxin [Labilibaculum antarcticum]